MPSNLVQVLQAQLSDLNILRHIGALANYLLWLFFLCILLNQTDVVIKRNGDTSDVVNNTSVVNSQLLALNHELNDNQERESFEPWTKIHIHGNGACRPRNIAN